MFLVFIPLCSDHNASRCTASCNARTFTDEAPTAGESAQLSVVSAAVNVHHTNVKPTVRHLRKLPVYHCCIPLLCTRLGAIHTATQVHTSARHRRIPVSCLTSCDLLQTPPLPVHWLREGRGGETLLYLLIWECP